jgi:hypothetical protein
MMKIKIYLPLLALAFLQNICFGQTTIKVFDTLVYFDGYASLVTNPPAPSGVTRLRNDLYTRKLSEQEISSIGNTLSMKVTVGALCDNYDRIGQVSLALVPKGSASYNPDDVQRIEIGRFITPFMNKNYQPTSVPYTFNIDNVASLLKESSITLNYDIWTELELFGVPYAANNEVAGCSGRNDVFYGSLEFVTTGTAAAQNNNILIPLSFKKDFNNYGAGATDTMGKTTKTFLVDVPSDLSDATFFLITSNHGANANGEEYKRRNHFVYFDDTLALTYKPGRTSCEPFRQYNTQANGIYGPNPKTEAQWQSFSNWCPGDVITTRVINTGALKKGEHTFTITVPDAVFIGAQGNFPLSLYLHGKTSGTLALKEQELATGTFLIYPNPAKAYFTISNPVEARVTGIAVTDLLGKNVYRSGKPASGDVSIATAGWAPGIYVVCIKTPAGQSIHKIQVL